MKQILIRRLTPLLLALLALPAAAINPDDLLPVDQAFSFSAQIDGRDAIEVSWDIADGYYMYRGRISFASATSGVILGEPELPAGEHKVDEFFGEVQTYRDRVAVRIPIVGIEPGISAITLTANSQGCADLGVCYPPHQQTAVLSLPPVAQSPGLADDPLTVPLVDNGISGDMGSGGIGDLPLLGAAADATILDPDEALPEDLAFRYEAAALSEKEILVRFTIAPGYYMYLDKFQYQLIPDDVATIAAIKYPEAVAHADEHFGDVMVFYDQIEVSLHLLRHQGDKQNIDLQADFMGCKEAGICYPPMSRTLSVQLPEAAAGDLVARGAASQNANTDAAEATSAQSTPAIQSEADELAEDLAGDDEWITVMLLYLLGIGLAFTPCVFPMVPILSSIIAGQGDAINSRQAFSLSLVYVLSMALVYAAVGVIAVMTGFNLTAAFQNAWVLATFSVVMVALALAMFGFYDLQLPSSWQTKLTQISNSQQGGTLAGAAVMGVLSAVIVGPCVAPPLMGVLIYISQSGNELFGGFALFALALGMGTPLLLIGTTAGKLLPKAGPWMNAIKAFFGVGLLALAIWLLERILPPTLIMLMWGALAITCAVYMGALERLPEGVSGWFKLWKSIGVMLFLLGMIQLLGAFTGGRDWMDPLSGLTRNGSPGAPGQTELTQERQFEPVKTSADLDRRLAQAAAKGQPLMLDFYADWCVDCKRMDRYTFPEPEVQAALKDVILLKADVTENDDDDQALLQRFGLIGPPATLFFDTRGQERRPWRVIGYMRAEAFAKHATNAVAQTQ